MSEVIKSVTPVQSRIIAPINEGNVFTANSYIQFKINASELPMWLVNDSYLRFDIEYTRSKYKIPAAANTAATNVNINKTYIRNAANIFNMINVKYGGEDLYSQTYNIEQNTLRMLSYGESYLNANYASFTTNKMIQDKRAYLVFDNGTATDATEQNIASETKSIANVMIPINQLLPFFMDVNSTGFPVGYLKKQIEINLYIAEPYKYLVDYDDVMGDFSEYFRRGKPVSGSTRENVCAVTLQQRYPSNAIKLKNVRMYCSCYVPTNDEAAVIQNKINSDGMKFKYNLWHIGAREVDEIGRTNNLPFSVSTDNTSSLILYCHEQKISPSVMHRPLVNSLYLRFGEMQLPFQPIPGDSFANPFEYKFTTDDVLNNIDTYFSETNNDYNNSYQYMSIPTAAADGSMKADDMQKNTVPGSSFIMMGANFTNSNDKLGSPSSRWNSQYQASFNSNMPQKLPLRFILGVKTEYGLIVKDGQIAHINL